MPYNLNILFILWGKRGFKKVSCFKYALESNTRPLVHCNADHAYTMTNGMSGILFILLLINKQIKAWNERTTTIKQPKEFSNDILL